MPQPATHYWVVRRAIPEFNGKVNCWEEWWDKYKNYFGLGTAAPDLFYFPCMPDSGANKRRIFWKGIADLIHHAGSYDLFCLLLNSAKKSKCEGSVNAGNKQFAFAFGFYCHVVTDCIFHPYVYRSTGDHWAIPDESKNELKHKVQEFLIDSGIVKDFSLNLNRIAWRCPNPHNELLDTDIAEPFFHALNSVYPDWIPLEYHNPNDKSHPIQQAYLSLLKTADLLFSGIRVFCFAQGTILKPRSISEIASPMGKNFFNSPYPNCVNLDTYTPRDLFNFSCAVSRKIFLEALNFFNSTSKDSNKFFKEHFTHYLNTGNWNLDTGIRCQFNNTKELHEGYDKMCKAKVETLKQSYRYFEKDYLTLFSSK